MNKNEDINHLLPFYVNGTLSEEEERTVEKQAEHDGSLKDEIEFLKSLRSDMKAMPEDRSPGEWGLKRLQKAIEIEEASVSKIRGQENNVVSAHRFVSWRNAAIAASLVVVLQSGLTLRDWNSNDDLVAAGGPSAATISVTFVADATEADIRTLLLDLNLTIVDGPSALGIYHLSTSADHQMSMNTLRSRSDLIESVQQD